MSVQLFLDSNILIYAAMKMGREPAKTPRAAEIVAHGDFGVSAQVLQEFFVNVTRKSPRNMDPMAVETAMEWIEMLVLQPCVAIDTTIVRNAIVKARRFMIDYWDAAILTAAESLGAEIVYSEDLNHGQVYGSVRVLNPFR
ncbi:MAG TPA: PIN domain-containing protein [Rhizomicrobium sp.]|jgi:predicted nucleic acid-binding protein|nr:PIN domain-containing protein [Rhizomicrobium sp.]